MPGDTIWLAGDTDKLVVQSGQFTSTVKDSEDVTAVESDTWNCATTLSAI